MVFTVCLYYKKPKIIIIMKTKNIFLILFISILGLSFQAKAQQKYNIVFSDGLYFTDASQNKLYSGEYKEFFENGALKTEMNISNGKPEGTYIIYFQNGKPNEVRAYKDGKFHGLWRTYNESGMLIAEAEYKDNKKTGTWHVWDDSGVIRYEMHYKNGDKSGTWYSWDEKGKLISEKKY
jgi:antitoxin component YwqK of YwqJK toxin-antitoxin module